MTRIRIVGGQLIETTGGDYNIYTKESIVYSAATTITETGVEKGVSYGNPETYTPAQIESEIEVKILKDTFLPLGISNFKGEIENSTIKFEIKCKKGTAENLTFFIKHEGSTLFTRKIDNSLTSGDKITVEWDGFSDSKIYDSTLFTEEELTVEITGADNEAKDIFKSKYDKVKWVDIKIDNNTKRIDVILRVNLSNGKVDSDVTKSLSDLISMALLGLEKYWGRNKTRTIGNSLNVNGNEYEIFIKPLNTEENSMPSLKIYASAKKYGRSRNWILSRKLFYNEGETYGIYQEVSIKYPAMILPITVEDGVIIDNENYSHTAAHEIGHEILQVFGGKKDYSYVHKSTSTLITQEVKKESTLPFSGEIDLMMYYSDDYFVDRDSNHFYERNIAHENDLLGLIWCSKLKIK
ncbi:hypothetical protein [uncultured Flavobacterium sp.]|uniref:hypothetical protein n=1 Tax=uncultured Flavobacterium sp. TaxID=165435 RepID=UPI0030EDEE59|tara:strand:+ start:604 stop:1830 length:1227 start_codon:yes stop_codon:yes gene_type:complete